MANPIFDTVTLTTNSARRRWDTPQARFSLSSLPGVAGVFLSTFGQGARFIVGSGFLEATGTTEALADKALAAAIRAVQAAVGVSGTFTDIDAETYDNCLLASYSPVGGVQLQGVSNPYTARVAVRFVIVQQDPTA